MAVARARSRGQLVTLCRPNFLLGRRLSRPNISGNTRGQFSPPGRAEGPAPLPPLKMTDLVTKVDATASFLGECPLKMCSFL